MSGGTPVGPVGRVPRLDGDPALAWVIFDAGHTLIHDATPAGEIAEAALATTGIAVPGERIDRAMAGAMKRVQARWHRGDWWLAEATVRALFIDAYAEELRSLPGLRADEALVGKVASRIYETYQDPVHWAAFPDVLPALEVLRAAGVRMGVVSDWGHGLEAILLELELGRYLEFLVASARLGVAKPDPRVFDLALARIGARPEECLYIGDTYVKDIMGARAAGIAAVLLDRSGDMPPMDCPTVRDMGGLLHLVGLPAASPEAGTAPGG